MRRTTPPTLAAVLAFALAAGFPAGGGTSAAAGCRVLPVTDALRTALKQAHGARAPIPKAHVRLWRTCPTLR